MLKTSFTTPFIPQRTATESDPWTVLASSTNARKPRLLLADINHQLFVPGLQALLPNLLELLREFWMHPARDLNNPGTSFTSGFNGHRQA